jgi:phospholipid/cholesterol/gamma-HCH transport system substrate-binding protein
MHSNERGWLTRPRLRKVGVVLGGIGLLVGSIAWFLRDSWGGGSFRAVLSLPQAHGITPGTPLTYRGVTIGRVLSLTPKPQDVAVEVQIWPQDRLIPRQSAINPLELKGKTVLNIIPLASFPAGGVPSKPLDKNCDPKLIICSTGRSANRGFGLGSLLNSVTLLPEMNSGVQSIEREVKDINTRLQGIDKLSQEAGELLDTINGNKTPAKFDSALVSAERAARDVSRLADKLGKLSDNTNSLLGEIEQAGTIAKANSTLTSVGRAADRVDFFLAVNQSNLTNTLTSIGQTSRQLAVTLQRLNAIARQVEDLKLLNRLDNSQLLKDLVVMSNNTADLSKKLLEFSTQLSDPQTSLKLRQILDSASSMFENLNKITSDLDDLTGNPKFREEIRRLIEGLSNLLSSTQLLQEQITYAESLGQMRSVLSVPLPPATMPESPTENVSRILLPVQPIQRRLGRE